MLRALISVVALSAIAGSAIDILAGGQMIAIARPRPRRLMPRTRARY
jgi:hypothetical protein